MAQTAPKGGTLCRLCGATWEAGKPIVWMTPCPKAGGYWKLHEIVPMPAKTKTRSR